MRASLRPLPPNSQSLRLHEDGDYGAPWVWAAVVTPSPRDEHCAVIEAAANAPPLGGRQAIKEALLRAGFTHWRWIRHRDTGVHVTREFDL